MDLQIKNHRLVDHFYKSTSKNEGRVILNDLRFVVIHYTAGFSGSADFLAGSQTVNSAHIVVERDGTIKQIVDFNRKANHAGDSAWHGYKMLNGYSIGIEIENVGPIRKDADGKFRSYVGNKVFDPANVVHAHHKNPKVDRQYWEKYTDAQLLAVEAICRALFATYPQLQEIVGHDDIAPNRKQDPGPAWPMELLRESVFGAEPRPATPASTSPTATPAASSVITKKVITSLNVRTAPDASAGKTAWSPLRPGERVTVLGENPGWSHIESEGRQGWVASRYLA